ncbi:SDR family NAD(P)-dependent oxidoreductase [Ruegeria sp. MALMAid1280]|uniref:SDR family NAD(P)-dependent oxidoreductase n=1 Tax=Ruegeria sp. MALMAid1280 TaxID=3411634 RepID=UPI003BA2E7D7
MTGGRQGIGRGIVEAYRREGAAVTTCGRGPRPDGLSDSVIWYPLGVTDADAVEELAHATDGTEILVNNAGVQAEKTVSDSTDADWNAVIGTNCRCVFNMCRAFIPQMSEGGSIINIGSISGQVADPAMARLTRLSTSIRPSGKPRSDYTKTFPVRSPTAFMPQTGARRSAS